MKSSLALLTVLLAVAVLHSEASEGPVQNQVSCCFSFTSRKIPLSVVKDYDLTGNHCPYPGVIFFTKRGRNICAKPSNAWVQEYIKYLKNQ